MSYTEIASAKLVNTKPYTRLYRFISDYLLYTVYFLYAIIHSLMFSVFFFFQAEDGIRDLIVTGVQTCALPICGARARRPVPGRPPEPPRRIVRPRDRDVVRQAAVRPHGTAGGHAGVGRHRGAAATADVERALLPAARPGERLERGAERRLRSLAHGAARRGRVCAFRPGVRAPVVGVVHQHAHAGIREQRHLVPRPGRLLVDEREHLPPVDEADPLVPPAALHRRRPAAVQLRRRPDRPAGAAVRLHPAPQPFGHPRILDPPAQRARRPPEPPRPPAAPAPGRLLGHPSLPRFPPERRAERIRGAGLQPRRRLQPLGQRLRAAAAGLQRVALARAVRESR